MDRPRTTTPDEAWCRWRGRLLALTCSIVAGCTSDDDIQPTVATSQPSVVVSSDGVRELTLADGTLDVGDLNSVTYDARAQLSSARMSFRHLPAAAAGLAGPSTGFTIACFETTQGQWQAIAQRAGLINTAEAAPWLAVLPFTALGNRPEGALRPACGISVDQINVVLAAYNRSLSVGAPSLRLPTAEEWEYACRAGSSGTFSWGNSHALIATSEHALVRETRVVEGADIVGGRGTTLRLPNAFGLYDMHGNVWELVDPGASGTAQARGGSWNDNLVSAGSDNVQPIDRTIAYALAGMRLVLDTR